MKNDVDNRVIELMKKLHELQTRQGDIEYQTRMRKLEDIIEQFNVLKEDTIMNSKTQVCLPVVFFLFFINVLDVLYKSDLCRFCVKECKTITRFVDVHDFGSVLFDIVFELHCNFS